MERDAQRAAQALASLFVRLRGDETLRTFAAEGVEAAERVLESLRQLRGAGDGEAVAYPERLGPWRNWCPPRGHVLDGPPADPRTDRPDMAARRAAAARRHGDPG